MRLAVMSTVFVLSAVALGAAWALGLGREEADLASTVLAHAVELAIAVSGVSGGLLSVVWRKKMP